MFCFFNHFSTYVLIVLSIMFIYDATNMPEMFCFSNNFSNYVLIVLSIMFIYDATNMPEIWAFFLTTLKNYTHLNMVGIICAICTATGYWCSMYSNCQLAAGCFFMIFFVIFSCLNGVCLEANVSNCL